jgi:hypothetical protein
MYRTSIFSFPVGHFFLLWIQIRIGNADPDPVDQNQCGSIRIQIYNAAYMYGVPIHGTGTYIAIHEGGVGGRQQGLFSVNL